MKTETFLLDSNVLIALSFEEHVHHQRSELWLQGFEGTFATCPITQGALVRYALSLEGVDGPIAQKLLWAIVSLPNHFFWPDDVSCSALPWRSLFGHRQVTDAYLVTLAEHHGGRLATLDEALAVVFPSAFLLPV